MEVQSNLAGVVIEVLVSPGEKVSEGQDIINLESMKMEIPIQSSAEGTVKEVMVNSGDFVNEGDTVLILE